VDHHPGLGTEGTKEGLPLGRQLLVLELGPDLLPEAGFLSPELGLIRLVGGVDLLVGDEAGLPGDLFTGNPSGDYCLTVQIDPKGRLCEVDETADNCGVSTDNRASSLLRIDVERSTVTVLDDTGCDTAGDVVVTSISPTSATVGSTVPVTITGSGFAPGMTVTFDGGSGPPPTAKIVDISADTIQATVTVKKGKPGKNPVWDVRVGPGVLFNGFTVQP
jgi:IPT/TIG domain